MTQPPPSEPPMTEPPMTEPAATSPASWLRRIRRRHPRRIRTRLTLGYAALFLAAGSGLLGITYGLVASSLPTSSSGSSGKAHQSSQQLAKLQYACTHPGFPDPPVLQCKEAVFKAGASAGSADQRQRALRNLLLFSLVGLGVMTIVSSGLGWVMAGRVLRPVRAITDAARRASDQHLGDRIALTGAGDELKELADTFDDMLERLDRAFAAQRRFVANASHELRTPLTIMRTAIDVTLAKPSRTPQQLEDLARRVGRTIGTAEDMIEALLTLADSNQGVAGREFVDLATVAEDALDMTAGRAADLGLHIDACLDPAPAAGDAHLLERLIWNLVDNAVRHNEPAGWIRLRTGVEEQTAVFQISNGGAHVPESAAAAIFEPFWRVGGRSAGGGAGLGLSIAASITAAHSASLTTRTRPEGGLDLTVRFPRCDDRPAGLACDL
jgi:signal transduction histidine kinase